MIHAVLNGGAITPLEPLPQRWRDGQKLHVESDADDDFPPTAEEIQEIETFFRELNELCSTSTPEDEEIIQKALDEEKALQKAQMQKQMGLE